MDLSNSTVKTPEAETETPTRIPPAKLSPFSNGLLKRHHPVVVTYKECLKNHAAALGGQAVDGCGEFMPSSNSSNSDPTSFKCAACGCHRNFHRRDPEDPQPNAVPALEFHRHHPPRANSGDIPNDSPSPPPISSSFYPLAPHMLLALSHGLTTIPDSSITHIPAAITPTSTLVSNPGSRKRFRTRFTQDQKEKMLELADRLGWRMQKKDEDLINEFCTEIGVDKGVFKVWMHNNSSGKNKDHQLTLSNNGTAMSSAPASVISNGVNYSDFSCPTTVLYHQQENDNNGSKQIVGGQEMNHQPHLQD